MCTSIGFGILFFFVSIASPSVTLNVSELSHSKLASISEKQNGVLQKTPNSSEFDVLQKQSHLFVSGFSDVLWTYIKGKLNEPIKSSDTCLKSFLAVMKSMESNSESVFKMFSASGRFPPNFYEGSYVDFGSYDQCLNVATISSREDEDIKFEGQYCLTFLEPKLTTTLEESSAKKKLKSNDLKISSGTVDLYPHLFDRSHNLSIVIGFCVPSTCSALDVESLLLNALKSYSWEVLPMTSCEKRSSFSEGVVKATLSQKMAFSLILIWVGVVFAATIIDLFTDKSRSIKPPIYYSFSLKKSWRVLMRKSKPGTRMLFLDWMRIFCYSVELIMHSAVWHLVIRAPYLTDRSNKVAETMRTFLVQPLLNTWSLEGLIFLGAISGCMSLWKKITPETSILLLPKLIFKKIYYTFIPLLFIISIEIALPLLGSGPIYRFSSEDLSKRCSSTFLFSIFHVTNFVEDIKSICVPQTWSLSVELQLFIMSCLVIFLYKRAPKLGLLVNIGFVAGGTLLMSSIFYTNNLPPQMNVLPIVGEKRVEYFSKYYMKVSGHVWSYFLTLLSTKLVLEENDRSLTPKFLHKSFRIIFILLVLNSFSLAIWNVFRYEFNPLGTAIYVVIYQWIGAIFWVWIFFSKANSFRHHFGTGKINEKIDKNSNMLNGHQNEHVEFNGNRLNSSAKKPNDSNFMEHFTGITLRILKGTFFIHVPVLEWFNAGQREPLPPETFEFITRSLSLSVLSIIAGFLFYLFVGGPFEVLINRAETKEKKKIHIS